MNSKQWLKLISVTAIALLIPRSARQLPHAALDEQTKAKQQPNKTPIQQLTNSPKINNHA